MRTLGLRSLVAALLLAAAGCVLSVRLDVGPPGVEPAAAFYTAPSDRTVHTKPAPLALGAAGFTFTDPTFGSQMLRVTDEQTEGGSPLRVSSSEHAADWNTTSTKFLVMNSGGGTLVFGWDGTTATRLPLTVGSQIEPMFSYVDPELVYGAVQHQIRTWKNNVATVVLDLDAQYPQLGLPVDSYIGGLLVVDADTWVTFFGGGSQDQHVYVHHSIAGLLDVSGFGWKIHAVSMDRTGRFVVLTPTGADIQAGRAAQAVIWDTQAGFPLTAMTAVNGGHGANGYGITVNQACCTATPYDAAQWQLRTFAAPNVTQDLIPTVLLPQLVYWADHPTWRAAQPGKKLPFITATYRYGESLTRPDLWPWRAWDDEVLAVSTDGSGTVWRFAHHQSVFDGEFWSQPIVSEDPTGRYAIFTSNWGHTVGANRQDVFLVHLN